MTPADIVLDEAAGVVTIAGIRYATVLFETRRDGTVTLRMFSPELEKGFCELANLKALP